MLLTMSIDKRFAQNYYITYVINVLTYAGYLFPEGKPCIIRWLRKTGQDGL
jgi:hypothetical protein